MDTTPSPGRRFVWYPEDIRIRRRPRGGRPNSAHQMSEDMTPWVREEAPPQPDEHINPLALNQCWREGCYRYVPLDDDLGLCPTCIEYLRTL